MSVIILNEPEAVTIYEQAIRVLFEDDGLNLLPSTTIARRLDRLFDNVFDKIIEEDTNSLDDLELAVYNLIIILLLKYEALGIIIRIYLLDKNGNILIHLEDI